MGTKSIANARKLQQTVNSTRHGVSILHMVCAGILVDAPSPALIRLIRSHPDFHAINHVAKPDGRGGMHPRDIKKESCVAVALRNRYTKKLEKIVEALLERHPSGDHHLDFHLKPDKSLTGMAQDSLEGTKEDKFSGFRARVISLMARRATEDAAFVAKKQANPSPCKK